LIYCSAVLRIVRRYNQCTGSCRRA